MLPRGERISLFEAAFRRQSERGSGEALRKRRVVIVRSRNDKARPDSLAPDLRFCFQFTELFKVVEPRGVAFRCDRNARDRIARCRTRARTCKRGNAQR